MSLTAIFSKPLYLLTKNTMTAFCKEAFEILELPTIAEFSYNFKAK